MTKKLIRLFLWFSAAIFCSCGSPESDQGNKTVFRYNEAFGITSLDPAFAKDEANIRACMALYSGLLQFDQHLKVQPCIAKDWHISDDGITYTFYLRSDVYFHENKLFNVSTSNATPGRGRAVVAKDFEFSLNRLLDPSVASPGAWVVGNVKEIKAVNDTTLLISLKKPFAPFPGLLCMPYCSVVPMEVVRAHGTDFRSHPCGTGPFKFSYWKEGVKLIFLRNDHYFEKTGGVQLPYLDAIDISFITDRQSAFIEFLKGNLDFLSGLDPGYKDELLTRSGELQPRHRNKFRMETTGYLNTEYLGIYMDSTATLMKSNPLRNKKVRQALSMGFNKQKMMAYLRNNMGIPGIYGMVPPGLPSFDSSQALAYNYDLGAAKRLLAEAGYPDGKGFPSITLSTTATYQDLCEFIKNEWENLGVHVQIDVNQAAMHRKMVAEQKLAFFRGSWIADYPDEENYLSLFYSKNFSPSGPNYTHYRNPEFDRLYEKAIAEINDSVRYSIYREMDQMVMKDAPVIILYYDKVIRLIQNNIEGLDINAMNLLFLKSVRKNSAAVSR